MKYFVLIFVLILFIIHKGNSQHQRRFDFFTGYGLYEGINIGASYIFKTDTQSIGLSFGTCKIFNKQENYFSIITEYNISILRHRKNSDNKFIWYLTNKLVLWHLEDEYYIWRVISFVPSLNRYFYINKRHRISVDAGLSLNIVVYNYRKTFEEVGWPYHVLPNMRVVYLF